MGENSTANTMATSPVSTTSINNGMISMPVIVKGDVFTRLVEAQRRTQKKMSSHLKNFTAVSGGPIGVPIEDFNYGEETVSSYNPLAIDDDEDEFIDENLEDGNVVTFHERENFDVQQKNFTPKKTLPKDIASADLVIQKAKSLYKDINRKPVDDLIELLNARFKKDEGQSKLRY